MTDQQQALNEPLGSSSSAQHRERDERDEQRVQASATAIKVERALVESVLLASLRWSAVQWRAHPALLDRGLECYRALAGRFYDQGRRGFTHLPLSLVMDLTALVELGERTPFASEGQAQRWAPQERRLRVDYENLLLGTLLQEPAFVQARERLPQRPSVRAGAVQRLVELLLQRLGEHYPSWLRLDPAHLRDIVSPPVMDIHPEQQLERMVERLSEQQIDEHVFEDGLQAMLRGISEHVYWRELLKEEDLFEIEHWEVLDTEAKRIGVRQISEVERRLGELRLPRVKLRQEVMEVETDFDDDTTYPTGGFSGLTNRGSFENLVRSELVYMGEGSPVTLFEMRFVENELLFYLRNDGVMRRRRRLIHFYVDLDPIFHAKSPGHDYPFATLTQGLIARLVRDLLQTFEEDAVTLHIHYVLRPDASHGEALQRQERERVEREQALLALVLGRELRQGSVVLDRLEEIDLEALQQRRGRTYAVAFVYDAQKEAFWRGLVKDLERSKPPVHGVVLPVGLPQASQEAYEGELPLLIPIGRTPFAQLAQIKNALFMRLIGG